MSLFIAKICVLQTRVYLFSLLMFKCYLSEFEGVQEKHVRHVLYWLVEENPVGWTEENIGERFLEVWDRLMEINQIYISVFF